MAYDLLPIENDVYLYTKQAATGNVSTLVYTAVFTGWLYISCLLLIHVPGLGCSGYSNLSITMSTPILYLIQKEAEVILDESDDLWCELRHQHIASVSQ